MKIYNEPVETVIEQGRLVRFHWRARRYSVVEVIDEWVREGRWWVKEERRRYIMAYCNEHIVAELYESEGAWCLVRLYD